MLLNITLLPVMAKLDIFWSPVLVPLKLDPIIVPLELILPEAVISPSTFKCGGKPSDVPDINTWPEFVLGPGVSFGARIILPDDPWFAIIVSPLELLIVKSPVLLVIVPSEPSCFIFNLPVSPDNKLPKVKGLSSVICA